MKYTKIITSVAVCAAIVGLAFATPALAESGKDSGRPKGPVRKIEHALVERGLQARPGVIGKVTSVSGSTITLTGRAPGRDESTSTPATVFTVNASNAIVMKAGATSTVSSIVIGDNLVVLGTVNGTSVVATRIMDGAPRDLMNKEDKPKGTPGEKNELFAGNGLPVIAGTISSVSGSSLVVTNKSNVQYTVDASAAVVKKGKATSTLSDLAVGDEVVVQGTVNGTSVSASAILERQKDAGQAGDNKGDHGGKPGFLGSIGGFFAHLFGF